MPIPLGEELTDEKAQALIISIYGEEHGNTIYTILAGTITFYDGIWSQQRCTRDGLLLLFHPISVTII